MILLASKGVTAMYETLMHEWYEEIWNRGNVDAIHRLMLPDAIMHHVDESGNDARGPEGFLVVFHRLRGAFPDLRITVDDVLLSGDKIAGRYTATGTHQGDHLGVPATGRSIRIQGMGIGRFRGGKLLESWNVWDTLAMMQQLGVPARAAATQA
jgi:steroid delta-isomerase-like uncharacterized protein